MGKGDKKTRRGKLFQGSFGVRRRKKKDKDTTSAAMHPSKVKEVKAVLPEPKLPKEVAEVKAHKPSPEAKVHKDTEVKAPKAAEAKTPKTVTEAKAPKVAPARKEPKTKKEEGAGPKHE